MFLHLTLLQSSGRDPRRGSRLQQIGISAPLADSGHSAVARVPFEPPAEEGVDQLGVEGHVDPRVQARVEREKPEDPLHRLIWNAFVRCA